MNEPVRTPDPWANSPWADDETPTEQAAHGRLPAASRTLLKSSVVLLIASTIVIFLSATASSNAAANSPMEQIALAVHRLSMVAMLIAFIGILAAYRLPIVWAFLEARAIKNNSADFKPRILTPDMRFLVIASSLLIAWVWVTTWLGDAILLQVTYWALLILAGLLANMVILHKGCVRSFAMGTLVTMLLVLFTWRSFLTATLMGQAGPGIGGRPNHNLLFGVSGEVTLSIVSGLCCAFYYNYVMRVRSRADQPPATPA